MKGAVGRGMGACKLGALILVVGQSISIEMILEKMLKEFRKLATHRAGQTTVGRRSKQRLKGREPVRLEWNK